MFNSIFLTYIKTTQFLVPLKVYQKWEVFDRLQINPKKF